VPHGGKIAIAKAQAGKSVSRKRHTQEGKEEKEKREKGLKGAKGVGFLVSPLLPFRGGCRRSAAIRIFERVFPCAVQLPLITNSATLHF